MRRKHLLTTGMIEGKSSGGKQREKLMDGLTKWFKVGRVTDALEATRNRDAQKVIINYTKEHGTRFIDCV